MPVSFTVHAINERRVIVERMDPFTQAERAGLRQALVLIADRVGSSRSIGAADLTRNGIDYDGPVLYGLDQADNRPCDRARLVPARQPYLLYLGPPTASRDPVAARLSRAQRGSLRAAVGAAAQAAQPTCPLHWPDPAPAAAIVPRVAATGDKGRPRRRPSRRRRRWWHESANNYAAPGDGDVLAPQASVTSLLVAPSTWVCGRTGVRRPARRLPRRVPCGRAAPRYQGYRPFIVEADEPPP